MVINLFGFLPAGFAIAVLLNRRMGNRFTLFLSPALLSSALSFAIELLQVHLPTRDPNYIDFAINSLAGTIAATYAAFTLRKQNRKKSQSSIRGFQFLSSPSLGRPRYFVDNRLKGTHSGPRKSDRI